MEMAKTVAAAQNQTFTVPDYEGWVQFAHLLDGYSICDDMGIAFQDWFRDTGARYDSDPDQLSVLDLRIKREEAILMQGFNAKKPDDDPSDPST